MKNKKIIIFIAILLAFVIFLFFKKGDLGVVISGETNMILSSPAFEAGGVIPSIYTCRGEGNNPPLEISNVPKETVSLVLTVNDPDASSGDFVHWLVWNIDPKTQEISDSLPLESVEGDNSFGKSGYIAPCPPTGTHHYYFKLYALNKKLELLAGASNQELDKALIGNIVGRTQLVGIVSKD